MSTLTNSSANKKRKKSDAKQQQQQLNKCLNEKRRREQENIYIEELAELINASFADMNSLSVKPDKCAILQETVNQIRRIKSEEAYRAEAAVQQGEVSSSKPALIGHKVFGPLLLEALEGFLFVVSSEGKVEFVTDNVCQFTHFSRDDVLGKSIYNFLHHGDHARFSSGLLPMAIGWPGEGSGHSRNRTFTCRLLIKPPDDQDETMEEKQQRISKYETMQISSMLFPFPGDRSGGGSGGSNSGAAGDSESSESEGGPCMMCVARRLPANEKPGPTLEQFTTKLDLNGTLLGIDLTGITPGACPGLSKALVGRNLHQLVVPSDASIIASHLTEALTNNQATSKVYRLSLNNKCPPLPVQTKTKLFKANPAGGSSGSPLNSGTDFLMATHSIMHDDVNSIASPAATIKTSMSSPNSPAALPDPTSLPALPPSTLDNSPPSRQPPPAFPSFSSELALGVDFEFFPSNPGGWELEAPAPGSTASGGSGSAWGSPPPPKPSPQQQSQQTPTWERSSPSPRNHPWDNNSQPSTPFNPMLEDADTLSTVEVSTGNKDSARLRNLLTGRQQQSNAQTSSSPGSSNRILKNLLNQEDDDEDGEEDGSGLHGMDSTPGPVASSSNQRTASNNSTAPSSTNNNMLLKLLNDPSDDADLEARAGLKKQNELLQQLLKDSDESDRGGSVSNPQEDSLLKSLGFGNSSPPQQSVECGSVGGGRKRPSLESDDGGGGKRLHQVLGHSSSQQPQTSMGSQPTSSQVSSSGASRLWEKNKMLASLLAKQPSQTAIPPIPTSVLTATPNERLPKVETANTGVGRGNLASQVQLADGGRGHQANVAASSTSHHHHHSHSAAHLHAMNQQQQSQQPKQSPNNPTSVVTPQPPQGPSQPNVAMPLEGTAGPGGRLETPADSSSVLGAGSSGQSLLVSSGGLSGGWDSTPNTASSTNDEMLSDILDQVIEFVPDNMNPDTSALSSLIDPMDGSLSVGAGSLGGMAGGGGMLGGAGSLAGGSVSGVPSSAANGNLLSERMAISAIQKSLMQCETAVKNPPQYQTPMQPPCAPPPMYPSQAQQRAALGFGGQTSLQLAAVRAQYQQAQQQQQNQQAQQQLNNQTLLQRRKMLAAQQQQQKQRLLQAQQQQRSVSVPDSQLSPSYGPMSPSQQQQQQQQQQQRQQQFQAFNAGFGGQQTTRLSPLPGQAVAQVSGSLPPFQQQQQQLSPRVTQQGFSQQQQTQQGWASVSQAGNAPSAAAAAASRLSLQQQQNPMLNAQLTATYPTTTTARMNSSYAQQQQAQSRPSMRGGGTGGGARSSPFTPDNAPPSSPSPGGTSSPGLFTGTGSNMFGSGQQPGSFTPQLQLQLQLQQQQQQQQQQQLRLHRAMSQPAPATSNGPQHQQQMTVTGANNGMPSDFVRQELRAAVCARTQQQQQQQQQQGMQQNPSQQQQQQQQAGMVPSPRQQSMGPVGSSSGNMVTAAELEAYGLSFEMPSTPGDGSNRLWDPASSSQQQPLGPGPSSAREEAMRGSAAQSSLLQKLLSE